MITAICKEIGCQFKLQSFAGQLVKRNPGLVILYNVVSVNEMALIMCYLIFQCCVSLLAFCKSLGAKTDLCIMDKQLMMKSYMSSAKFHISYMHYTNRMINIRCVSHGLQSSTLAYCTGEGEKGRDS